MILLSRRLFRSPAHTVIISSISTATHAFMMKMAFWVVCERAPMATGAWRGERGEGSVV